MWLVSFVAFCLLSKKKKTHYLGLRIQLGLEERGTSVHEGGHDDEKRSHNEEASGFEVAEKEVWEDRWEDDRDGGCEAFQNAVRVLDSQGHDQSSESLK